MIKFRLHQRFKSGGRIWKVVAVEFDPPVENKRCHIIEMQKDPQSQEILIRKETEFQQKLKEGIIELL